MIGKRCSSVIVEGLDSLGKSLQSERLAQHIQEKGFRVKRVKSPYNDRVTFRLIYWMLDNGLARRFPNLFQVIHFLNKLVFQWFILPGLLDENDFIIFDRWCISMWAYGVADGASAWMTRAMLDCIAEPDITVLLDGERHTRDRLDDSYERDVMYQRRVRGMYLTWATSHDRERVVVVNANQEVYKVTEDIVKQMETKGIFL